MAKKFTHTVVKKSEGHLVTEESVIDDKLDIPTTTESPENPNPIIGFSADPSIEYAFITQGQEYNLNFQRTGDITTPVKIELLAGVSRLSMTKFYELDQHDIEFFTASIPSGLATNNSNYIWVKITFLNGEARLDPVYFSGTVRQAYFILKEPTTTAPTTTIPPTTTVKTVLLTVSLVNASDIVPVITVKGEDGTGPFTQYSDTTRTLSRYVNSPYLSWSIVDPSGTYSPVYGSETAYSDLTKTLYMERNTQYADLRIVVTGLTGSTPVSFLVKGEYYEGTQTTSTNTTLGPIRMPHGTYSITPSKSGASPINGLVVNGDKTVYFNFTAERTNKFVDMYSNVPAIFSIYSNGNVIYESPYPMYNDKVTEDTSYGGRLVLSPYANETVQVRAVAAGYDIPAQQTHVVGQVYPRFTLNATLPERIIRDIGVSVARTYYIYGINNYSSNGIDYPVAAQGATSSYALYWNSINEFHTTYYVMDNLDVPSGYAIESAQLIYKITGGRSMVKPGSEGGIENSAEAQAKNHLDVFVTNTGFQGMAYRPTSLDGTLLHVNNINPLTRLENSFGTTFTLNIDATKLVANTQNVLYFSIPTLSNATSSNLRSIAILPLIQHPNGVILENPRLSVTLRRV